MSVVIMTAVWQSSEAKGSTRLVLLSLADQANDDGYCWPSVGSIAKRCRISERSVQDHLRVLEDLHEIVRAERSGRSTMYRVIVQRGGADSAPLQISHPAELAPPQELHPARSAPGGAENGGGGVRNPAPRTVRETSPNPKRSARNDGIRLPEDFVPSEASRAKIREQRPDLDLRLEHENFLDYWVAKPGPAGLKLDWDATWRKWMRGARGSGNGPPRPTQPVPVYVDKAAPEHPPWEAVS